MRKGYRPILESFKNLACDRNDVKEESGEVSFECRRDLGQCGDIEDIAGRMDRAVKKDPPTKDAKCCRNAKVKNVLVRFENRESGDCYFKPAKLGQLQDVLKAVKAMQGKALRLIASNTSMGFVKYFDKNEIGQPREGDTVYVDVSGVRELKVVECAEELQDQPPSLIVGGAVCIADLIAALNRIFVETGSSSSQVYEQVIRHLSRIANKEVRSVGSWAGNLVTCAKYPCFTSDLAVVFVALNIEIDVLASDTGSMSRITLEQYIHLLRNEVGQDNFIIVRAYFPPQNEDHFFYADKTAARHVNAHSIVNIGLRFVLGRIDGIVNIEAANIVVGGLADDQPKRLELVEHSIEGMRLDDDSTLERALSALDRTVKSPNFKANSDPRNTSIYRLALIRAFIYKAFLSAKEIFSSEVPLDLLSVMKPFAAMSDRRISCGTQAYPPSNPLNAPIGDYIQKTSATLQASGEAKFTSDHYPPGVLFGQLVFSDRVGGHATIRAIDASVSLRMPGVKAFLKSDDIPGINFGGDGGDGKLFFGVGDRVTFVGSPVGLIVADSQKRARAAAKEVKIIFEENTIDANEQDPVIDLRMARLNFERELPQAARMRIRHGGGEGLEEDGVSVFRGDTSAFLSSCDSSMKKIEGRVYLGGQKHFFMEPQATVAEPDEGGAVRVTSGTQFVTFTQAALAKVLAIPTTKITVMTRRVGGAYGGKINLHFRVAAAASLAALILQRPCSVVNERNDDMTLMGGREPIEARYTIAFDPETGKQKALEMHYAMDGAANAAAAIGKIVIYVRDLIGV